MQSTDSNQHPQHHIINPGNSRRRSRRWSVVVLSAAALFATVMMAPPESAGAATTPTGFGKPPPPPKYSLKAVKFTALDESLWDGDFYFPISDEPYFTFSSVGPAGTATMTMTHTFDDVDSGESRDFSSTEGCMWGGAGCTGATAPYGIGLSVSGWENDWCCPARTLRAVNAAFSSAGPILSPTDADAWVQRATPLLADPYVPGDGTGPHDDHLGNWTMAFSPTALAAFVPVVGSVIPFPILITDGDADYLLLMQLRRTA